MVVPVSHLESDDEQETTPTLITSKRISDINHRTNWKIASLKHLFIHFFSHLSISVNPFFLSFDFCGEVDCPLLFCFFLVKRGNLFEKHNFFLYPNFCRFKHFILWKTFQKNSRIKPTITSKLHHFVVRRKKIWPFFLAFVFIFQVLKKNKIMLCCVSVKGPMCL